MKQARLLGAIRLTRTLNASPRVRKCPISVAGGIFCRNAPVV